MVGGHANAEKGGACITIMLNNYISSHPLLLWGTARILRLSIKNSKKLAAYYKGKVVCSTNLFFYVLLY